MLYDLFLGFLLRTSQKLPQKIRQLNIVYFHKLHSPENYIIINMYSINIVYYYFGARCLSPFFLALYFGKYGNYRLFQKFFDFFCHFFFGQTLNGSKRQSVQKFFAVGF